jgi:cell division protein FtsL
MTMRLLNILVIGALVLAASYVYKIKFDSTLQAESVAKLHGQLRKEREAIAVLRAEWAKLETPARVQELADRHLHLRRINPRQFDDFEHLPARPLPLPPAADPIGAMLAPADAAATGSIGREQ